MNAMRRVLCVLLWLGASGALAQSKNFGSYTVHYSAVNSTFLTPAIAAQYHIVRSSRHAFLTIAVLRNNGGSGTPVTAKLAGSKTNLMQQTDPITFHENHEGDSISYIGEFDFSNAETVRFRIDVQPEGKGDNLPLEWTTQLYTD